MFKDKAVIVVGASSGIGEEVSKQLLRAGAKVALVARREAEMRRIVESAGKRGQAFIYPHDVAATEQVPELFQKITHELGGFDAIIYCAGVMPAVATDEYNFAKDKLVFDVNVLGAFAWLNQAAVRVDRQGHGIICGIGSVAGDRGRKPQPVYCASKAALETYLEGLRNRLGNRRGIKVVTIKPGPVMTPMTAGLKMPLPIKATDAARQILGHLRRGSNVAYVPAIWRPIMFLIRNIPSFILRGKNI